MLTTIFFSASFSFICSIASLQTRPAVDIINALLRHVKFCCGAFALLHVYVYIKS